MSLRPDQLDAKARIAQAYAQGATNVLGLFPTGWGKTHVAADMLIGAVAKGRTCGFFTDREEIAFDTAARGRAVGLRVGLVMADAPEDPGAPVQVVSIPTAVARGLVPAIGWGIWDEAHHLGSPTWRGLFDAVRARGAKALGITATGQRGDGRALDMFDALVPGPQPRWCIARGLLVPVDVLADPEPPTGRGLAADPLEAWTRWAPGTRALVFCANVAHVAATVAAFRAAGHAVEGLTAHTDRATRRALRARLAAGELVALIGCGVFIEGFDAPTVETVVLARPFGVCGTFLQAIGRGLRLSPATGKRRCTVIDLLGSVHAHGLPDEDRAWSLGGDAPVQRTERLPALRRCQPCGALFRPAVECPRCGARAATNAMPVPIARGSAERLELVSHLPEGERDARYFRALLRTAAQRLQGVPPSKQHDWAVKLFRKKKGRAPPPGVAA